MKPLRESPLRGAGPLAPVLAVFCIGLPAIFPLGGCTTTLSGPSSTRSAGPGVAGEAAAAGEQGHPAASPVDQADLARPVPGREAALALSFPDPDFTPPEVSIFEVDGVPVFHLEDPSFPLVDVHVQVRGGVSHVSRADAPAMSALSPLLRTGGTRDLPPDSVDLRLDLLALQLSMGSGGGGSFASINALTSVVDEGVRLLRELLLHPTFADEAVELWLAQERDRVRRREEDPGSLAFAEFNRLVFGDHPVGWVFTEEELTTEALDRERLRRLHALTHCRENLLLGVAGDASRIEAEAMARILLEEWPPCATPLPPVPIPELRRGGGVWILPRPVEQTTVVVAGPGGIRQEDTSAFFASRVAHSILGAGGFTSRLFRRIRTEEGLAYGASSVWTTPVRYEGIVGAVTATRPERTVQAVALVLEIFEAFREAPPEEDEVTLAVDQALEGQAFAFESASQVVARAMGDRAAGLPDGWFTRYLEGIAQVDATAVHAVVQRYLDPGSMVILLVGDAERFGPGLDQWGPVWRLHPDGRYEPWEGSAGPGTDAAPVSESPRGSPRSPR